MMDIYTEKRIYTRRKILRIKTSNDEIINDNKSKFKNT